MTVREKLAALREKMADYKMDMYLIGSEDFHIFLLLLSFYLFPHFDVILTASNFTSCHQIMVPNFKMLCSHVFIQNCCSALS